MTERRIGFLFPGQGAQYVGMGKDLFAKVPSARQIFEKANAVLEYPLSRLCFEGPEADLTRTLHAQPAIFVTSIAALTALREKFPDVEPAFVAGLSLGEFTALVAAGSFSFEEGLKLVKARAQAMEKAAEKNPGTMTSVIGLSQADCEALASEAGCQVANLNAPDQIVLSGSVDSIEKACRLAEAKGAKRAIRLKVGGAFHSALMMDAKEDLEKAIRHTQVNAPRCVFIPNASAIKASNPQEIRELLAHQLVSPVRWIETMSQAVKEDISLLLEVGPGKVLKGLAKKCAPSLAVEPCGTFEDLQKLDPEIFLRQRSLADQNDEKVR